MSVITAGDCAQLGGSPDRVGMGAISTAGADLVTPFSATPTLC
jgi:hypothetical protein